MKWLIKNELKSLSKRAEIDREFKVVLKRHLIKQIPSHWYIHVLKPIAGVTAIVLIFGSTTSAYAYSSDNVLPHHPLYEVRTQIENVESVLASNDPIRHADVKIKHLEKRVHEIDLMGEREIPIEREDVERVNEAVKQAIEVASEVPESKLYDQRIRRAEVRSVTMFQEAAENNSEIEEAIDASAKDLGRIVWKLDEERRHMYQNIELRYEAELFGIDWKLDQGLVVVETEDIETIIEEIAMESVDEVIKVTSPVVIDEPTVLSEPAPEPEPAPAPEPTEVVAEPVPQPESTAVIRLAPEPVYVPVPEPEPAPTPASEPTPAVSEPVESEPETTSTWPDYSELSRPSWKHLYGDEWMKKQEIIRERLRKYFEKLKSQVKID